MKSLHKTSLARRLLDPSLDHFTPFKVVYLLLTLVPTKGRGSGSKGRRVRRRMWGWRETVLPGETDAVRSVQWWCRRPSCRGSPWPSKYRCTLSKYRCNEPFQRIDPLVTIVSLPSMSAKELYFHFPVMWHTVSPFLTSQRCNSCGTLFSKSRLDSGVDVSVWNW